MRIRKTFNSKDLLSFSFCLSLILLMQVKLFAFDFRVNHSSKNNDVKWSQVAVFKIVNDQQAIDFQENEKLIYLSQKEIDDKFRNDPDALPKSAFETTQDYELRKSRFQKKVLDEEQLKLSSLLIKRDYYECALVRTGNKDLNIIVSIENYNADKSLWKINIVDPVKSDIVTLDLFIIPSQAEQLWQSKDGWRFFSVKKLSDNKSDFYEWSIPGVNGKEPFSLLFRRTDDKLSDNNNLGENGIADLTENIFAKVEIDAEFPGGVSGWSRYITREIERNIDALQAEGKSGSVTISFVVDTQGNISDVRVVSCCESELVNCLSSNTLLATMAINAIKRGPKWKPAIQNGRSVKSRRKQVVSFSLAEEAK